ncbi:MAG: DUF4349 domain-containing protein [Coriobacteriia bacterium]|nr:DUF4349 domain-containing protein [Coriobacteriia bacterium]
MKKFSFVLILTLILTFLVFSLTACAGNSDVASLTPPRSSNAANDDVFYFSETEGIGALDRVALSDDDDFVMAETDTYSNSTDEPSAIVADEVDRKLIFTARATLETKEFDEARTGIEAALTAFGGHTQDSELSSDDSESNLRFYRAVLRIPSEHFDSFVEGLSAHANLTNLSKSGQDVTDVYFDNEARIRILEAEETELLALMGEAGTVAEIFSIRDRISEVRAEVERLKGQNIRTDNLVALSTVSISLLEVETISPVGEESFWTRAGHTFTSSTDAFVGFVQGFALVLIAIAPFLLLLGAIAAIMILILRRNIKKGRVANKAQQDPPHTE